MRYRQETAETATQSAAAAAERDSLAAKVGDDPVTWAEAVIETRSPIGALEEVLGVRLDGTPEDPRELLTRKS